MAHDLRQLSVVHLSDLHFGKLHRFEPLSTPSSDVPTRRGIPSLFDSLNAAWAAGTADSAVIMAVTGDVTQDAAPREFDQAAEFLGKVGQSKIHGEKVSTERTFLVPGNHDVVFSEANKERRWQPYSSFYQKVFRRTVYPDAPEEFNRVHDLSATIGVVIAELNSCTFVMKGSSDEQRGQIDIGSVQSVRRQLEAIDRKALTESIKIALVHHHPVLLPTFAEAGRGYDCIINADKLLTVLRDFGFHLILHGHKHFPHVYSYDAQCAWTTEESNPTIVVAGGSAACRELPGLPNACNSYNYLTIKWNPSANEGRVLVETRGLVTSDKYGRELLPEDWCWKNIRTFDRTITPQRYMPLESAAAWVPFNSLGGRDADHLRVEQYEKLRGNMPVAEVAPALHGDQAYEARVWIESHNRSEEEIPERVIWSAGKMFGQAICEYSENPHFCTTFEYWSPMLIQARLFFKDGGQASGFVYARLPRSG